MNSERIATILQAAVSDGEIADELRDTVKDVAHEMAEDDDVREQIGANVVRFIDTIADEAVTAIVATRGDRIVVEGVIGSSFGSGLVLGLAVAALAGD